MLEPTMFMIMAQPPFQHHQFCDSPPLDLDGILAQVIPFLVAGFNATAKKIKQE